MGGREAVSCPFKVSTPKENGDKKDKSGVMVVNQELIFRGNS